ncbi:MAG TPA: PepSY domain-containing protein [Candidatus Saccharimonadia bacterium]
MNLKNQRGIAYLPLILPVAVILLGAGTFVAVQQQTAKKTVSASIVRHGGDDANRTTAQTPTITLTSAKSIAMAQHPGSTIRKVELETEDGVLVYSVRFVDGARVDVRASTGAIERNEPATETNTTGGDASNTTNSNSGPGNVNSDDNNDAMDHDFNDNNDFNDNEDGSDDEGIDHHRRGSGRH